MTVTARRAATRERMCVAALEVFAHRGVLGASVEEICEAAGFTRGAFYSNFESKDDLCIAVLRRRHERMLTATEAAIAQADSAVTNLGEMVSAAAAFVVEAQSISADEALGFAELQLHAARTPEFRTAYLHWVDAGRDMLNGVIEAAFTERGLGFDRPIGQLLDEIDGVCTAMMMENIIRGETPATSEVTDYISRVMLESVTQKN